MNDVVVDEITGNEIEVLEFQLVGQLVLLFVVARGLPGEIDFVLILQQLEVVLRNSARFQVQVNEFLTDHGQVLGNVDGVAELDSHCALIRYLADLGRQIFCLDGEIEHEIVRFDFLSLVILLYNLFPLPILQIIFDSIIIILILLYLWNFIHWDKFLYWRIFQSEVYIFVDNRDF